MINTTEEDTNNLLTTQKNSLQCPSCGNEFSKIHKPLILKCSHNICQICHSLNKSKIICFICKSKFEGKDARRFPVNFLLLEIIERGSKDAEDIEKLKEKENLTAARSNEKKCISKKRKKSIQSSSSVSNDLNSSHNLPKIQKTFKCIECNINFPNDFHFSTTNHTISNEEIIIKEAGKEYLILKSEDLMKCYKSYNEKLDKNNENFFIYLTDTFVINNSTLKEEIIKSDPLDNLLSLGVINKSDKERIKEYFDKYLKNEKIKQLINNSENFEEMIKNISKLSSDSNSNSEYKDIKIHHFLSSYFYYEEILEKKLSPKKIEEKLFILQNNLKNNTSLDKNFDFLQKTFIQDISVEVYNGLNLEQDLNKNIKLPSILTKNNLIIFDPLIESLKNFSNLVLNFFPSEFYTLTKFDYFLNSNYNIFISGGLLSNLTAVNNLFSINLENKEVKNYQHMTVSRYGHSSILVNNKLFIIGGYNYNNNNNSDKEFVRHFEKLNLLENSWTKLQNCPHDFKNKINLLNFEDEYLYIFDNLINFFYYHIKNDKWTTCKPKFKGSYHLEIENFISIYSNSNLLILGGVNNADKENYEKNVNKNIYFLKDGESVISIRGEFKIQDVVSQIDHGFMLDNNYLLDWSDEKKKVMVYQAKDANIYKWENIVNKEIKDI